VGRDVFYGASCRPRIVRRQVPYGDSARYDFAIEYQGRFLRVQVKSTKYKRFGSYICHTTSNQPYRANQIDFIAAYVIPLDVWYILPTAALQGKAMVCSHPSARPRNTDATAKPGTSSAPNRQSRAPPPPDASDPAEGSLHDSGRPRPRGFKT